MQKSNITVSCSFFLMCNQYLMKNISILLNILLEMDFVSLCSILFGIHYLVLLNILFEMNSLIFSKDLNQKVNSLSETP